jgi:predicted AlkP superfamily pyrophosphatase or phosphodiesterase
MRLGPVGFALSAACTLASNLVSAAPPKVIIISLDGATPALLESYIANGTLPPNQGLSILRSTGVRALRNTTATPSLTAVSHIAIATGSTSVNNDIPANTYHAVAQPIGNTTSGFGGPIGGYRISPLGPNPAPTAEPLWVQLRNHGKKVVTATWPGGDGVNVTLFGTAGLPVVQSAAPTRTVDYTVPFGSFGGIGAQGFRRTAVDFVNDDGTVTARLLAAGKTSYSPVKVTAVLESIICGNTTSNCAIGAVPTAQRPLHFAIKAAAIDTTNDGAVNYDTLVFFNANANPIIPLPPFAKPATGAAFAKRGAGSAKFYFDGSGLKIGTAYIVTTLAPDLSVVRFARYGANFIPRNVPVLGTVDDINNNVGFWAPQPDFRIPERISPGFGVATFPDVTELEAMYQDQVRTFVSYQTSIALRALKQNPDADLAMFYIEQPDGSGHQFTLTDPRQATDFLDNRTVGTLGNPAGALGQNPARVAAFDGYLKFAYQQANAAVHAIIKAVGLDAQGRPKSNIIVVSDHGMAPFHSAVVLRELLLAGGVTAAELGNLRFYTSGPAVNVYINLAGRERGGTVNPATYQALRDKVAAALTAAVDPNPFYNPGGDTVFTDVFKRPDGCGTIGFCTDANIGQDFGDVFAMMRPGYNFDGFQAAVTRLLDGPADSRIYSVPNFYGAHGHNSDLPEMSAILYAAGPNIKTGMVLPVANNIDVAPTVMEILGVPPAATVNGTSLSNILLP